VAVASTHHFAIGSNRLMSIRSRGGLSLVANRSHVIPHKAGCQDSADCVSELCDTDGSHGCKGQCVSIPDADGKRHCSTKRYGETCNKDGDCLSGMCDLTGFYGCKDLCVSEVEDDTRHCRVGHMGDRCTHNNQCLSGVCDTNEEYNCRDLCVSDVLPSGHMNRYCDAKKVGETCNHNENCETGICDFDGILDEGLCDHRCLTQGSPTCPQQQCMRDCNICLGDLLTLPKGLGVSSWWGYPEHLWDHGGNTGLNLRSEGHQSSEIYLRIPAACVEAWPSTPCVLVEGALRVNSLHKARLSMRSAILPGFPQPKPEVDEVVTGQCPRTSDGFPEAGNIDCCYNSSHVAECGSELWGNECQSLLLGTVVLGEWSVSWERQTNSHDFAEPRRMPFHDSAWLPLGGGSLHEFNFLLDFQNAKYKYFRLGDKHWQMDDPLVKYRRDRNCNHVRDWPNASWEFSLEIAPESDKTTELLDADVQLTRLSVTRKANCDAHYR